MKVAIMVDGGFLKKKHRGATRRHLEAEDVVNFCAQKIMNEEELKGNDLFRIYYYDCRPFAGKAKNPLSRAEEDYSERPTTLALQEFCRKLAMKPMVAFRSGILSIGGWTVPPRRAMHLIRTRSPAEASDLQPNFSQKQVDMKIGLDIAWLASKQIVDKIVLVTGDSDFIPAMKFARREGVRVYLAPLNHSVKGELIEHSDGVLRVACGDG